jgi:hypothetical protein
VFVLYAVTFGLIVGLLPGGSFAGLAELRIRWGGVILAGLLVQVVLFSAPVAERVHEIGPLIYVLSTGAVLTAVLRNWRIVGLPMVALGAASNAAAILANGGFMPAGAAAIAALGTSFPSGYSNSSVVAHPALVGLTDIFALPHPIPFANVFSIGDVIIAVGIATVLIAAMRERDPEPADSAAEAPSGGLHAGDRSRLTA